MNKKELYKSFLELANQNRNDWKYPFLKDICQLSLEYLTLDGLEDAGRSADIPDEILEICEKELKKCI